MSKEKHVAIVGIPSKYTTLNPLDKESLEKAIAKLNEIQQNNKSLELAKLFVELYENELKHIGECYETNHHSS